LLFRAGEPRLERRELLPDYFQPLFGFAVHRNSRVQGLV
jgi:hypothetical protein